MNHPQLSPDKTRFDCQSLSGVSVRIGNRMINVMKTQNTNKHLPLIVAFVALICLLFTHSFLSSENVHRVNFLSLHDEPDPFLTNFESHHPTQLHDILSRTPSATAHAIPLTSESLQNRLFLPVFQSSGTSSSSTEKLLATGQTVGYIGNRGNAAEGNRDDGDLIHGRFRQYEFSPVDKPATQVENIVTDPNTGLMWIRNVTLLDDQDGQGVHANVRLNEAIGWQEAIELAQALIYAGYDDWRLPNLKEMQTLVDYGESEPSIDPVAFPLPFDQYASGLCMDVND
ncbi:DUF1566 domain-containing protein [Chloroflexi bacterium TSY]|nr:DUF1566 domain-containing protein [Chloroflexi bacterium TSY]